MTPSQPSRLTLGISYALSSLVVVFLLADAAVNVFAPQLLAEAQAQVGFPAELSLLLAGVMLGCAVVFAIPQTAVVGAILITAFAGGAICTHLRVGEIGSPPQFIAAAMAALAWLSLYLRNDDLRAALSGGRA